MTDGPALITASCKHCDWKITTPDPHHERGGKHLASAHPELLPKSVRIYVPPDYHDPGDVPPGGQERGSAPEVDLVDAMVADVLAQMPRAIGETLRARREKLGWSQERVAEEMRALGFDSWRQTTVAKVELPDKNGQYRMVAIDEGYGLAYVLGLPRLDDLLSRR